MGLGSFFKSLVTGKDGDSAAARTKTTFIDGDAYTPAVMEGELMRSALQIGIDYIAAAVGKCEMRTFLHGEEVKGDEWYRWNIRPNHSMSSTQFWSDVIHKLYFNGEALIVIVDGQLLCADCFSKTEYALKPTFFQNVSVRGYTLNGYFSTANSVYLSQQNCVNLQGLIASIGALLDDVLKISCTHYYNDGGERGILYYDTSQMLGDKEKTQLFDDICGKRFKAYFNNKNAVVPLFQGMKYESKASSGSSQRTSPVSDMTAVTKEAYSRAGQALRIPPALLLGETADVENNTRNFLTFCIDPLTDSITEAANAVIYGKDVLKGNYLQADTTCIEHIDIFSAGGNIDKIHSNSILSVNEIRRKVGEPPIAESWADDYIQTKNYAEVVKKGESNDGNV